MQKLEVSPSVGRELQIGEFPIIKKIPNFENKFFADFRKTTKSIGHEILQSWNPKMDFMGINESKMIREVQ
ncbi:hypothetical protein T01_13871 [Trichinella spiralis]|uniref:Uncharacterized protein n=1 Tax=Trichinella spiralis TaxID=6334 RepID=A0A0V1BSP3_TRISP|nr:hypothetical protein T01_13871 [Trichinella spiralis]